MAVDRNRLEAVFAAALTKTSPAERAAYLDEACAGDAELRRQLEALLRAHDAVGGFLERPAGGGAFTGAEVVPLSGEEGPGTRIGPYKLLQQIGEGGMGVVYMAEQEQPVRRRVALKIIKPGLDSAQVVARFEAERQALALMDHPHIARVLDAGATPSGRPYFVMELVHGVPITRFCDDRQLTPRERLELFVPVCQAIQHAHQKGIIHRDVKPSNVLVTMHDDKPVPKVIDFGVVKAVERRLTEKTLFTAFGALVGTLEYMSPEQAEMNAFGVDTRSDIYSLGVLLYELLTGTTPLERRRLREAAYTELLRLIKEVEPPRPSVRLSSSGDLPKIAAARKTDATRLPALLRGEIDWIVMRCLEKDRTRRYDTANALARDVERYLKDEPVEACPPSVAYRLGKFARKHRVMLTTAAAFAALLLAAAGVSTWLAVEAMRAEAVADEKRQAADRAQQEASGERNRANREASQATANAAEARQALDRLTVAKGIQLAEEGNLFAALPWFVKPLERGGLTEAEEKIHRTRIACYLRHTPGRPTLRQILFHDQPVTHAAFSPDAKQVLTVTRDVVHVWNLHSGESVATLPHPADVEAAQFSSNGIHVLTTAQKAVWTWDARSGQQLGPPLRDRGAFLKHSLSLLPLTPWQFLGGLGAERLANVENDEESPEISRDGRRVLFAYRGFVRLLDLDTGKPIQEWVCGTKLDSDNHALGPDGQRLLLVRDGLASVYETPTGKTAVRSVDHGSPIQSVAFSPDGTRVLTVGEDGSIRVWDARTWQPLARMSDPNSRSPRYGQFSPDNRLVASWGMWISGIRDLAWWDVQSGRLVRTVADRERDLQNLDWRPTGQQLLRVSKWGDVTLWNVSSPESPAGLLPHGSLVAAAVYGPDSRTLLTATSDGEVRIWDLGGRTKPFALKPPAFSTYMQLYYIMGGGSWTTGPLFAEEQPGHEQIKRLLPPGTHFDCQALSPDESRVLTSHREPSTGRSKSLQLWDVRTGRPLGKPLQRISASFTCAAFSANSRLVVAAEEDGTVRLMNARTGELIGSPLKHWSLVCYAAFSPDGELLITCGMDHTARLWRTQTGEPVGGSLRHEDVVTLAAFSANGQTVATASLDGTVRLWDDRGISQGMLTCKSGRAWGLLFHPNGLLLVVSSDRKMRLWDVATQQDVSPAMIGVAIMIGYDFSLPESSPLGGSVGSARYVVNRDFDPPSDNRPTGDLVKLAQLYSGRRLDDQGGSTPLPREERQSLWRELRARYPAEFAITSEEAVEWRIEQLQATASDRLVALALNRRWLATELADAGWQPSERESENLERGNYLQRLVALALHSRHAEATAAADALAARWPKDHVTLYNCACVHALAAGAVKGDATLADRYAARAVALLRQAAGAGYRDDDHIGKDPDLDALRRRTDFADFLWDLADTREASP